MKNHAILVLAILLFSAAAMAQSFSIPSSVQITPESPGFQVKVSNDSASAEFLSISVLSPVGYTVSPTPVTIQPYSTQTFTLKMLPKNEQSGQAFAAEVSVQVGQEKLSKNIEMQVSGDFSKKTSPGTGFAVLPDVSKIGFDGIIDGVLILIIIVLAIALIARLAKRNKESVVE